MLREIYLRTACPERSILDFRFELAFQMILNELPGSIYNPEDFKKRKRSGKDCGYDWVSIHKFCGKWVGTVWIKVKQEYQQHLCPCRKNERHYCRCNKAVPYCSRCYAEHLLSVSM